MVYFAVIVAAVNLTRIFAVIVMTDHKILKGKKKQIKKPVV
jgi:hypothetical protein